MRDFLLKHKLWIDILTVVLFLFIGLTKKFWQHYTDNAVNNFNLFIGIVVLAFGSIKGIELFGRIKKNSKQ